MATFPYIGNGPYCYANCFAMMLGPDGPSPSVIEVATCSPFGMQMIEGLPFFDPEGWDPLAAFTKALEILGWRSSEFIGKTANEAITKLRQELKNGPVFTGPLDMSKLSYQPGHPGADHYVIVLSIDDMVHVHDPAGHPYAVLPIKDFMASWGTSLSYGSPYAMRFNFQKVENFTTEEVVRRTIPEAKAWLKRGDNVKAGSSAASLMSNLHPGLRGHLTEFAIRVGTRRIADAATCLSRLEGYEEAVEILSEQAKLLGSLQYFVRVKDSTKCAKILTDLGPTYSRLLKALEQE